MGATHRDRGNSRAVGLSAGVRRRGGSLRRFVLVRDPADLSVQVSRTESVADDTKAGPREIRHLADTCLNDNCAALGTSASGLNQALIERKTRFGLACDFVGVREFVSKVLESD